MIKSESQIATFEEYCDVMYNHSPAFIVLPKDFKVVMYNSFIYNQKLRKPEMVLHILTSQN